MMTKDDILALSKEERKSLLAEKSSQIKYTDSIATSKKPIKVKKLVGKATEPDTKVVEGEARVKIVCNTANFCDSHMDVLAATAYDSSVAAKGNSIPHIADHKQTSTSHVGDVTKVYTEKLPLTSLGYEAEGSVTALVMESTVRREYNEEVYKFYKNGKIQQHSIGLRYKKLELALNSQVDEDKEEFAVWEKAYPSIVNKEVVDSRGYFWYVEEIDIIENSCVLFGANSLTPTLQVKSDVPVAAIKTSTINLIGKTMELEQALARITDLEGQVATAKAETITVKGEIPTAVAAEQTRGLAILASAKTFGISHEVALKQVKSNIDADTATMIFESIKAGIDAAGTVETETDPTSNPTVVASGKKSDNFMGDLHKHLETEQTAEKSAPTWEGM